VAKVMLRLFMRGGGDYVPLLKEGWMVSGEEKISCLPRDMTPGPSSL